MVLRETQNPEKFVSEVLELRTKYQEIVSAPFVDDKLFQRALKESFEYFINLDTRAAQFLSLFTDALLRRGASQGHGAALRIVSPSPERRVVAGALRASAARCSSAKGCACCLSCATSSFRCLPVEGAMHKPVGPRFLWCHTANH